MGIYFNANIDKDTGSIASVDKQDWANPIERQGMVNNTRHYYLEDSGRRLKLSASNAANMEATGGYSYITVEKRELETEASKFTDWLEADLATYNLDKTQGAGFIQQLLDAALAGNTQAFEQITREAIDAPAADVNAAAAREQVAKGEGRNQ